MRVLICMVASMIRGRRWVRVNWFETYDRAGYPASPDDVTGLGEIPPADVRAPLALSDAAVGPATGVPDFGRMGLGTCAAHLLDLGANCESKPHEEGRDEPDERADSDLCPLLPRQ